MKTRVYLAASVAAGSLALLGLGATSAFADNIVVNQWYTGHFTATPSPLLAGSFTNGSHGPILPGGFANAIAAPGVFGTPGTWVVTLSGRGTLTVTDVETSGDRFQLFDNGAPMTPAASPFTAAGQNPGQAGLPGGFTSVPCANCSFGENDINGALGNADYSSGTFLLRPGVNVIMGDFMGVIGNGDFNFIAESVPEPDAWAMLLLGLGGLGALLRTRRHATMTA